MPNYKKIYFRLFGNFDIVINKKSVLSKGFRQQGFNRLFVFFLLNRDRVFDVNTLIEKVWPTKYYHDNNSIMRTQIFRLKRQLSELLPSLDFRLEFTHGGYCFSYDPKNVILDTDIFENLCTKILSSRQARSLHPDTVDTDLGAVTGGAGEHEGGGIAPPSLLVYTPGMPSAGYMPGQTFGSFTQNRADRLINRNVNPYTSGLQYSDGEILKLCGDALGIYQSGFLNEAAFDGSWLESYKQNYRRLWLKIIETFTDLCYRVQDYNEIITLCQEVLRFDDSEEYIHEIYMNALRKSGYHQDALKHYDIITSIPAHKDAFLNSPRLRELHKTIIRESDSNKLIDEEGLEQFIIDLTGETGPVVRDKDTFLRHCSVLRLYSERSTYLPYICIIETININLRSDQFSKLKDITYVTNIVKNVFRKSDIICEWNDRQLLVLMACKQDFDADELTHRIKLAIIRDGLSPEEADGQNLNLAERLFYLPLSIKIMPIGETRELSEYQNEINGYRIEPGEVDLSLKSD